MELYGKQESLQYYSADLRWGQKLYQELRFVLVEMGGVRACWQAPAWNWNRWISSAFIAAGSGSNVHFGS